MKKRTIKSAIINVSGTPGEFPTPFTAVNSASKVYVDFFSKSIGIELGVEGSLIEVYSYKPGFVTTKLSLN